jgi:hypothetical protein
MEEQDYRSKTLMVVVQRYFNRQLTSAPQGFDPVRIVSLAYGSVATAHGSNIPDGMVRFYAAVITYNAWMSPGKYPNRVNRMFSQK